MFDVILNFATLDMPVDLTQSRQVQDMFNNLSAI